VDGIHHIAADGPLPRNGADALGLVYGERVGDGEWIAVPVARLDPAFFVLSSGAAGSGGLRDFVRESHRGQLWFVGDEAELAHRLSAPD
jgi:hypothetical protein